MANWSTLKAAIANVIKTNGNQEITGAVLQNTLNNIVNNIGENATFAGVAIPTTNPGAPDGPVFYFAAAAGTYSNFGGISLDGKSLCILITDKQQGWKSQEVLRLDKISPDLSEMLRRITGSSTNSSAYTDPFISLGNLDDWRELSSVLNTLYDNKYMGRCRATVSGMNIEIYQFVHNLENKQFSQIVLGNVVPSEDGTQVVIKSASYFDIISRYHINDVWSEWKSVTKQNIPIVTASTAGLMSSADKAKLDGMPGAFVLDLGQVSSETFGDAQAAKSEIAGNRNIFAIRYTTQGVSALKTTVIIQWCNGIDVSAQIKFTDKSQWRRNVTGATGVAGSPTNAFEWECTGAHYMGYHVVTRKLQLKDYEQRIIKEVQLPLATPSAAGLMSSEDKKAVGKIGTIETNVTTLQSDVETLKGNFFRWNYSGGFNVGDTIPVSEFLSKSEVRASILKTTMYVYYSTSSLNRHNYTVIWRDYNDDGTTVTFSFAFFDGEAVVKHVLTLNEAQDAWIVTA